MNKKKYKLLFRLVIGVVLLLIAAIVIIVLGKTKLDQYQEEINNLIYEIENNRQVVYVVADGIEVKKGEVLLAAGEEANVMRQEIYSGLESEYYITEEDLGSLAIVDMKPGTPIMKNMITTKVISHDTREAEICVVDLMIDQKVNDDVDIRIMFPNGEDYLVLAKKPVKNLVLDSALFYTYLNEEEILRLSCATVDAYTITGTKIYATRYVESNIQKEAIPDYKVSAATMDLMAQNPNIVTIAQDTMNLAARLSLEERLKGLSKEQLAAVAEGHGIQDTAKASVLTSGVQYQLEEETEEKNTDTTADDVMSTVEEMEENVNLKDAIEEGNEGKQAQSLSDAISEVGN